MRQSVGKQQHMHVTQNWSETLLIAQNTDGAVVSQQKWCKLKLCTSVFSEVLNFVFWKSHVAKTPWKTVIFKEAYKTFF